MAQSSRTLNAERRFIHNYDYIVVGGGIAGVTCVEHLNLLQNDSSILLLTASDLVKTVTNIHPLTKTLDTFDIEEKSYKEFLESYPSITILQFPVIKVDSISQIVHTALHQFHYKKLCICSGGDPKVLSRENPFVLWIRDTDSIKYFQEKISTARRIVVVGNGGIATELVYEISGLEVIWAIKDKSINAVFIDPGAAEFLKGSLESDKIDDKSFVKRRKYTVESSSQNDQQNKTYIGSALGPDWHSGIEMKGDNKRKVTIESGVEVKRIFSPEILEDWPVFIELNNGKTYGCDFIVSATGVTPNTKEFLKGNDFKLGSDGGLLVNDKMETSIKNIFSAGDVCAAGWKFAYQWFQMRLWTQARQMGSYAAKCMWASFKDEEIYLDFCFELFSHATKFFGFKVILLGLYNGQKLEGKYEILLRVTKGKEYIKCIMVDGKMQGAILIGETDLEETFENLILNQIDLSRYGEDLLDPNIDIEDYFD